MYGYKGHDSVSGEAGADRMYGGPGNEDYIFGGKGGLTVDGNLAPYAILVTEDWTHTKTSASPAFSGRLTSIAEESN
ncbi:MAG: hypothetical protein M3Q29_15490 [Chloroflexota bacterium]|nr:hypothetical protein [Chloroflexota bacterium]